MRRLMTTVFLATLLLSPALPVHGGIGRPPPGTLDATPRIAETGGSAETQIRNYGDRASPEQLPDFDSVWTAAVVAIGVGLIVGMVRTAREHQVYANAPQGHNVSRGE